MMLYPGNSREKKSVYAASIKRSALCKLNGADRREKMTKQSHGCAGCDL
jgi:hypothetical protein